MVQEKYSVQLFRIKTIKQVVSDFNSANKQRFVLDESTFVYNDWSGTITFELKDFNKNKIITIITISGFYANGDISYVPMYMYRNRVLSQGFFIPNTVNKILSYAFEGTTLPQGFKIPLSSITRIEKYAFKDAKWDENSLSWFDENGNIQKVVDSTGNRIKPGWKLLKINP